jgi:MFS transporter, FHS family, L-fucose permease
MAGGIAPSASNNNASFDPKKNYVLPLMVLTSLFFMWAVATNFNDILMPKLKTALNLTNTQTSFVQVAFFLGYGIMSIPAGIIIKQVGFKTGILIGLFTCAIGSLAFIPAANTLNFSIFLAALFVIAGGITFLQVAANAFVSILGDPKTASARLNLSQAFNSIGAFVGPWFAGEIMLDGTDVHGTESVKIPYMVLCGLFVLAFLLIAFSKLPEIKTSNKAFSNPFVALKYRHTLLGVIAILLYVGAEVAIGSYFVQFTEYLNLGLEEKDSKNFLVAYMICAAAGRFLGSILLTKIEPGKAVGFNAIGAILLIVICIFGQGYVCLIALVLIGLMNSIMFPTIFTLGVKDLGEHTESGSSLIITAIIGGAIVTPIMAYIIDIDKELFRYSYLVPALCYVFIAFYGFIGSKVKE